MIQIGNINEFRTQLLINQETASGNLTLKNEPNRIYGITDIFGTAITIKNKDGNDIFMHFSVLDAAGCRRVEEGDTIVCDIGPGRRGKQVLLVLEVKFTPRDPSRMSPAFLGSRMPYVDPETLEDIQGEIKWFNPLKGFGFIYPEDGGRDIFLHASVLRVLGMETIEPGVKVKAKVTASERGREARAIEFVNPYIQNF